MWKIANASALLIGLGLIVYGCRVLGDKQVFQTIDVVQESGSEAPPIDWEIVKPVYDGDTITVKRNGEKLKVRFACIDSPELKQPMGKKSRDYLRGLISRSQGRVGLNIIKSDRYGRSVAEVWINTPEAGIELVQSLMLVTGNAYLYERYKNDCPSWKPMRFSQEYAKSNKIGVWGGEYEKPWEYRRRRK
ncbi:MAG: thermonuclease family protein [Cyanobacteria bacterium P01_D01_bin.116]